MGSWVRVGSLSSSQVSRDLIHLDNLDKWHQMGDTSQIFPRVGSFSSGNFTTFNPMDSRDKIVVKPGKIVVFPTKSRAWTPPHPTGEDLRMVKVRWVTCGQMLPESLDNGHFRIGREGDAVMPCDAIFSTQFCCPGSARPLLSVIRTGCATQ